MEVKERNTLLPDGYYGAPEIARRLDIKDKKRIYEMANEFYVAKHKDGKASFYHLKTMQTIHELKKRGIPKSGVIEIINLRNHNKKMVKVLKDVKRISQSKKSKLLIDEVLESVDI